MLVKNKLLFLELSILKHWTIAADFLGENVFTILTSSMSIWKLCSIW